MLARSLKTCLFAFLALGPALSLASSSLAPHETPKVITNPLENPEVMKPVDPAVNCTADPRSPKCLPQADAFKRAGEAASYLSWYQEHYSNFGQVMQGLQKDPEAKKKYDEALRDCVNGTGCTPEKQAKLLTALVQYNFGKELKAQMLENEARGRRMSSVENSMSNQDWRDLNAPPNKLLATKPGKKLNERDLYRPAGSGSLLKNTFRLNPKEVPAIDWDKLSISERDRFGADFNREFNQFVGAYTNTAGKSRWHYVPAVTSAVGGGKRYIPAVDIYNSDPKQGKAKIDTARFEQDSRNQGNRNVQEIVASFKKQYEDVVRDKVISTEIQDENGKKDFKTEDSMKAAMGNMGFGLPNSELARLGKGGDNPETPTDVAAAVVVKMNNDLYQAEMQNRIANAAKEQRVPSSRGPNESQAIGPTGPTSVSAVVDVAAFDNFLNKIWPADVEKKK